MLSFEDIGAEAMPGLDLAALAIQRSTAADEQRQADASRRRVRVEDKRIINAQADVNQLEIGRAHV